MQWAAVMIQFWLMSEPPHSRCMPILAIVRWAIQGNSPGVDSVPPTILQSLLLASYDRNGIFFFKLGPHFNKVLIYQLRCISRVKAATDQTDYQDQLNVHDEMKKEKWLNGFFI